MFREVRRVLKPQATLWIEVADSYANDAKWGGTSGGKNYTSAASGYSRERRTTGLKAKDLLGAPWLLAFALRADGWYLRQCIIWQKPNPMPESVRDRCTTAHSYVLLLAKSRSYYFDAEAIAEPAEYGRRDWNGGTNFKGGDITRGHGGTSVTGGDPSAGRNARSVWSIPTEGYAEAHFATWPQALVERIIKAGCPEWVCKAACGKPRERIVNARGGTIGKSWHNHEDDLEQGQRSQDQVVRKGWIDGRDQRETVGWSDCGCGAGFTPGVCLDPFMGSGTTALVARRLGRRAVGVELNAEYAAMAARRLQQLSLLAEAQS